MAPVKKLTNLEIDEVSLVDRPANQHGLVAIAKRGEEEKSVGIYDTEGNPVDENDLEHGDVVYDDNGTEYVFTALDASAEVEDELDEDDEEYVEDYVEQYEPELVGKANLRQHAFRAAVRGRHAGDTARHYASEGRTRVAGARNRGRNAFDETSRRGRNASIAAGMQYRALPGGARAGLRYGGAATGGGLVVGTADRRRGVHKSLGGEVLEELSKALTAGDRDEVIAKAMDMVETANTRAARAERIAKSVQEQRELEEYVTLASEYDLPVDPEDFGEVLKALSETLDDEQLAMLDRIFTSVSDDRFVEKGYAGAGVPSEIMDQVNALAYDTVAKRGDLSPADAVVGLFEANPAAYDQYIAEKGI